MIFVMPDSDVDVLGVDMAAGVLIPCVVPSLQTDTDKGVRFLPLSELSIALNLGEAFAADGAITKTPGSKRLTKAGVGAYTLAAPTADEEGAVIVILNETANAHVITATNLLDDGVTGGAKDTATFGAFVGATLTLRATSLKWQVLSKNVVTIAAV